MNELQIFNNPEFGQVRTVMMENEPWFVGKDVADALGYTDLNHTILDHVDEEDRVNSKTQGQNNPDLGQRGSWLINESGLYSLIFGSKLETAKRFKHWVTSEVLPAIRKSGSYSIKNNPTRPLTTDDYLMAARIVAKCDRNMKEIVIDLLQQGGFEIKQIPVNPRYVYSVPESVQRFSESHNIDDITDQSVGDVYECFEEFCKDNGLDLITKIIFSKLLREMYGVQSKVIKQDGKCVRVYVREVQE